MKLPKKKGSIFTWSLNSMLLALLFHSKSQHTIQANESHISTNTACRYKIVHCRMVIQCHSVEPVQQPVTAPVLCKSASGRRAMAVRCFQATKPMAGKVCIACDGACYWMDGNIMRHQSFVRIDLPWAIKLHLHHLSSFVLRRSTVFGGCVPLVQAWFVGLGMPLI